MWRLDIQQDYIWSSTCMAMKRFSSVNCLYDVKSGLLQHFAHDQAG
jgi:hypothetical protein